MVFPLSVTLEHTVHEISQRAPKIFATSKIVLIYEQNIMLKAGIEMRLEPEFSNNWVVMAVYVGVDTVHALEDLPNHAWEGLGERDTYYC
jgi:hypothetical protein